MRRLVMQGLAIPVLMLAGSAMAADGGPAFNPWQFGLALVVAGLAMALFVGLTHGNDLLRDNDPKDFGDATVAGKGGLRRTYSLAQTQMAWWFLIVLGSYLYLYLTTGKYDLINEQALILMGLGTGSALGAAAIEQVKGGQNAVPTEFQAVLQTIAEHRGQGVPDAAMPALLAQRDALAARLSSQGFLRDLLTDENGMTMHRTQMLVWTFVLGGVYLTTIVGGATSLPEFSPKLLALLGISAGTYLGFKIPEKPN